MNWKQEGRIAAEWCEENPKAPDIECPWPLYTPEGNAWFQGWNEVANERGSELSIRPSGCGQSFNPSLS